MCLLLASATQSVQAQEPAKQHRIAIVIASGPATRVDGQRRAKRSSTAKAF